MSIQLQSIITQKNDYWYFSRIQKKAGETTILCRYGKAVFTPEELYQQEFYAIYADQKMIEIADLYGIDWDTHKKNILQNDIFTLNQANHGHEKFQINIKKIKNTEIKSFLVPLQPSKIICIGRNYAMHAKELGNAIPVRPTVFSKAVSSLCRSGDTIERPTHCTNNLHHEAELAVVIGKTIKNASLQESQEAILGYVCANDVTARDMQQSDQHFTRAKSFDTFCPIGLEIAVIPKIETVKTAQIQCFVGDQKRQNGNIKEMIFDIQTLISYVSHLMTLQAGDLLLTGTPAGVGPLLDGDVVRVTISHVGFLCNPVQDTIVRLPPEWQFSIVS